MGTQDDPSLPHHLTHVHHLSHAPLHRPAATTAAAAAAAAEPIRRRLSLDGDLPTSIRPDGEDGEDGLQEGLFQVYPSAFGGGIDVSACSKAGWEPVRGPLAAVGPMTGVEVRKENQDAFCVFAPLQTETALPRNQREEAGATEAPQIFLGVFDGHGAEGRPIAHYARDFISNTSREAADKLAGPRVADGERKERTSPELHRQRLETLKAAFSRAERGLTESDAGIDHVFSGTTAVVAWLFGKELYTAWAGDSRCVIGRALPLENGRLRFKAVDCSHDQKPVRPDEKRRVRSAGGRIARWQRNMGPLRVWLPRDWTPGLAMTRSIGDTVLSEFGVSPIPEVTYTTVGVQDSFIVLASDGVWEFMTSQEVVDFIGRMRREGRSASDASEALVREAVRRWRRNEVVVDDATAVVMWMTFGEEEDGEENATDAGSEAGKIKSAGEVLLNKPRKVFSKTRARVSLKPASLGVHLIADNGQLIDFVCKNDVFQGM